MTLSDAARALLVQRFGTGEGTGRADDEGFSGVVLDEIMKVLAPMLAQVEDERATLFDVLRREAEWRRALAPMEDALTRYCQSIDRDIDGTWAAAARAKRAELHSWGLWRGIPEGGAADPGSRSVPPDIRSVPADLRSAAVIDAMVTGFECPRSPRGYHEYFGGDPHCCWWCGARQPEAVGGWDMGVPEGDVVRYSRMPNTRACSVSETGQHEHVTLDGRCGLCGQSVPLEDLR